MVFVKEQSLKSPSALWQRVTIFNHGCHQTDHLNNHWAVERVIQTRVCVCVPLPPFLVPLFPSLYCRAGQTAELSQQGVRLWKGRERDRGGEIRWLKATFQHLFWGMYELMMAGAADQNLANGGGGVPLGPGLPLIWAKRRPWNWCCVQAIYFLTMTCSECFVEAHNVDDLRMLESGTVKAVCGMIIWCCRPIQ